MRICASVYAGDILELVVRALDVDRFEKSVIYFSGLNPSSDVVPLPAGVDYPKYLPLKYGCGNIHYSECNEAVEREKRMYVRYQNFIYIMLYYSI